MLRIIVWPSGGLVKNCYLLKAFMLILNNVRRRRRRKRRRKLIRIRLRRRRRNIRLLTYFHAAMKGHPESFLVIFFITFPKHLSHCYNTSGSCCSRDMTSLSDVLMTWTVKWPVPDAGAKLV